MKQSRQSLAESVLARLYREALEQHERRPTIVTRRGLEVASLAWRRANERSPNPDGWWRDA